MTLVLEDGLEVKTFGFEFGDKDGIINFGDHEIPIKSFLVAVEYVLENSELIENDPRLEFIECIKSMEIVDGFDSGRKRLRASPALSKNPFNR
ncbi:hypothetical protein KAI56_01065 [Candidatus Parcubacteria bacterium]|nr:hypothetical protein [Candidatus Parcubacteria bacterium]